MLSLVSKAYLTSKNTFNILSVLVGRVWRCTEEASVVTFDKYAYAGRVRVRVNRVKFILET